MHSLIRAAAAAAAVTLSACASNGLVSSWQAPDATPLHVDGSRVAAVVMMREEGSRRAAEDALARELSARGAIGVRCRERQARCRSAQSAAGCCSCWARASHCAGAS